MLVLSHSEALRVDFYQLCKRVHKAAPYAHSSAHRHVLVRHFLACHFGGAVYACSVLAYRPYFAVLRQGNAFEEIYGLAARSAVAYGHCLYAVAVYDFLHGAEGFDFLVLRRVGEDDFVVKQSSLFVEDRKFAAVAEARVHR